MLPGLEAEAPAAGGYAWNSPEAIALDRASYAERETANEAGLAQVQTWEWERMVLPRGTTRRVRQKVTIRYNPAGWCKSPGGCWQETCQTLMKFDRYPHPAGSTWREQWD